MAGEKVLIIDDSIELRTTLETILAYGGYGVASAGTGQEGLDLALEVHPDVILVDLELPDMTGLKLLREFNRHGLAIPTVMITGYGSEGTAARALRLGVRDYLVKPFTTEEVLSSIERALEEVRLRREVARLSDYAEYQVRCLDLFDAIGTSITSSFDLDDILQRILEAGQLVTGAESGGLLVMDETSEQLQVVAVLGQPKPVPEALPLWAGDERLHPVLREGVPVRLESAEDPAIESQTGDMVASVLQVPLSTRDRVFGLMTMDRREEGVPFSEHDEQILKILAGYTVIALEKAGRLL